MCPACMASAAVVAGSVISTGGIAALVAKVVRSRKSGDHSNHAEERRSDHGYIEPGGTENGNGDE